jgi:hypothetical protein
MTDVIAALIAAAVATFGYVITAGPSFSKTEERRMQRRWQRFTLSRNCRIVSADGLIPTRRRSISWE